LKLSRRLVLKRSRWVAFTSVAVTLVLLGSCGGQKIPEFNATPTVSSFFPSNITAGSQGFTMAVSGTGFQSNSKGVTFVNWNGSPRSTTFNDATGELSVQIFASDVATANSVSITATNPVPGGGTSQVIPPGDIFTIVQPQAGLTIASLDPANATAGGAAFAITVDGTGFATNDVVTWNGSQRVTTIAPMNTTVATAQITADDIATAGTASVAVSTPNQVVATPSLGFAITGPNNSTPSVSSLSPNSATHGGGDFEMKVNGSGFGPNAFVEWNGSFIATALISASQLVAYIPAAETATMGTATVTVTNPAPGGGTSSNIMFTIN
jgi:trimeric autotransporter adhesin